MAGSEALPAMHQEEQNRLILTPWGRNGASVFQMVENAK